MKTKEEILRIVEEEDVEFIRLQFTDMLGNLKNVAVTASQLERVLDKKYSFDGCAMFGDFYAEEDLYLHPDLDTFVMLPWRPQQRSVARLLCDVRTSDGEEYAMSSRTILKKVVQQIEKKGYTFYVEPECEFFLFHTDQNNMPTTVTYEQAGYMDVGPVDWGENARRDMVLSLEDMGFEIKSSHHESAPAQHEIDFEEAEPLEIADSIVTFKSAVRSIAKRFGLHATFMPKPKKGVPGSGMHLNISLYKDHRCVFNSRDKENPVTEEALWFMGGIMEHAKGMCAVTNPLVNSYKRILTGFDAPLELTWTRKNINALVKVGKCNGEDTKIELRFPDPSANPYLAIAMCLAAGIDGIERKILPGKPAPDCYAEKKHQDHLPKTLNEAVFYLKQDKLGKEVLGEEFVSIYSKAKKAEWNEYMEQVSDWEIEKYLNRV